jgi:adenylate cyclase
MHLSDRLMAEITARLELETPDARRSIPVEAGNAVSIGRGAQNTIVLRDESVSRKHAVVDCQAGNDCYITDAGSRNGTFLNDARVGTRVRLHHGDRLRIGTATITFWCAETSEFDLESSISPKTTVLTAHRYVTVVVADIRDFTGLARRVGEKRLSEIIGEYIRLAGEELDGAAATSQKYIGDAVMGIWDHGSEPPFCGAVLPALAGALRLFGVAATLQERFGLDAPLKIGVGMNTGPAILGNLGSRAASDFTALGDTINKAFRLESASKDVHHDLVIGGATWECLSPDLKSCFHVCTVTLKGYEQPERAYGSSGSSFAVLCSSVCGMNNSPSDGSPVTTSG